MFIFYYNISKSCILYSLLMSYIFIAFLYLGLICTQWRNLMVQPLHQVEVFLLEPDDSEPGAISEENGRLKRWHRRRSWFRDD